MATSAAKPTADAPAGKGKSKLILIVVLVLVLAGGGVGAVLYMNKAKAAAAAAAADEEEGSEEAPAKRSKARSHSDSAENTSPTFVPLDPFVVNLADKGTDRYAQIAVTLEIDDAKFADELKKYMPAIRNNILMVLAHKTADELLDRAGKEALADEIMQEAVRPMGLADDEDEDKKSKGKKKRKAHNPINKVHFANFIIQ